MDEDISRKASLNRLSNEILIDVAQYLGRKSSKEVSSLALCSRLFNRLATPILYRTYSQGTWYQDGQLAKLLLRRPELGSHVTSFCIEHTYLTGESSRPLTFSTDEVEMFRAKRDALGYSDTEMEQWLAELKDKQWGALLELILSCTPNVMEFHMRAYKNWHIGRLRRPFALAAQLQDQNTDSPAAMRLLKGVSISVERHLPDNLGYAGLTFGDVIPFLKLKSVTHASFLALTDRWTIPIQETMEFSTSTLVLDRCQIRFRQRPSWLSLSSELRVSLHSFLQSFKNLRHLQLNPGSGIELFPNEVGMAIAHLKHCLESLTMDDHETHVYEGCIGSLSGFRKLYSISIDSRILIGDAELDPYPQALPRISDVLPKSLKRLKIVAFEARVIEQLVELVERRKVLAPNLEYVHVMDSLCHELLPWQVRESWNGESPWDEEFFSHESTHFKTQLVNRCKDAGIRFELSEDGCFW